MTTIRDTLKKFLADTGEGNPRSMSSPSMVIKLFGNCLDEYAHEDLNEFERQRDANDARYEPVLGGLATTQSSPNLAVET